MGAMKQIVTAAVLFTAFVCLTPVDKLKKNAYTLDRFNPKFSTPREALVERITEASFYVETQTAYMEFGNTKPVWLLFYNTYKDEDSDIFLETYNKYCEEAKKDVICVKLDGMSDASIGWRRLMDFKPYNMFPFLFYLRDGKWFASKSLSATKLLKTTANQTTDVLHFFAEEGWKMGTSGKLPPATDNEEIRRVAIIKAIVRSIEYLHELLEPKYWIGGCAAIIILAYLTAEPEKKAAKSKPNTKKTK